MSASQQVTTQTASAWAEPPWSGWIETTGDALLILEAARRGLIPRVTRRLVDSERKMITSGSVFVFDEEESGIKRWTDGFFWSPSRILGNFLLYRETDKRGAGHRGVRNDPVSPDATEQPQYNIDGVKLEGQTLSRPKGEGGTGGVDRHRERTLVGSLTNSYKFKPDGLMKKTFSLTIGGVSQHLISYYKVEDVESGRLRAPSSLPELACLDISPEYLDKTHFRNPPKVEIGIDGIPHYRGEADDIDGSPPLIPAALSSGLPTANDGQIAESSAGGKRSKRYDPYGSPAPIKRSRKAAKNTQAAASPSAEPQPPSILPQHQVMPGYPDPNVALVPHPYPPYGVPSYYQLPGYPLAPPHAHMYSPGPYPPNSGASPPPPPTPQYTYAYAPAASAEVPQGAPQAGQQQAGYYPYYPPPPGHYPGYAGVPWPHYPAGYPPQSALPAPTAPVPDAESKGVGGVEAGDVAEKGQ